jgi:guanylate kinase
MERLKLKNKLISIFILPPNIQTLRDRLSNRDMKDKLILKDRMNQFKNDVLHWKEYDYIVINNDLEKCYQAIMSIIDCEKKGKKFLSDQNKIKEKISELIS